MKPNSGCSSDWPQLSAGVYPRTQAHSDLARRPAGAARSLEPSFSDRNVSPRCHGSGRCRSGVSDLQRPRPLRIPVRIPGGAKVGSITASSNARTHLRQNRGLIMPKRQRNSMPSLPGGGGYEFEVVQSGPPTHFIPPPAVKAHGGLISVGDGEGVISRPAPISPASSVKKSKRRKLRTFTARFRHADTYGITSASVQGHELNTSLVSSTMLERVQG